jgi:hypothetical protein
MADPTGTVGAAKENSFEVATTGGPRFIARLEQLGDATDKHERALAQLELGQSAAAAFTQARQELAAAERNKAEAEALRNQAAKTLDKADAAAKAKAVEADRIVANAKALQRQADQRAKQIEERERVATEAIAEAKRAQADANRVRGDFQSRIDNLRASMREIAAADALQH